jgi:hypothetical protein
MRKAWALALLALPLAGCGIVQEAAPPKAEVTLCYNGYGAMMTQPLGVCSPCWTPTPPADRMPLGTISRCGR